MSHASDGATALGQEWLNLSWSCVSGFISFVPSPEGGSLTDSSLCSRHPHTRRDLSAIFFWGCRQFNFLFFTISVIRFWEGRINPSGNIPGFVLAKGAKQRTKIHELQIRHWRPQNLMWVACWPRPSQAELICGSQCLCCNYQRGTTCWLVGS